jgi:hypothetical protein
VIVLVHLQWSDRPSMAPGAWDLRTRITSTSAGGR